MRIFEQESEKPISSLPPVTPGKSFNIDEIPILGTLTFTPVLIEWKGAVSNPLYTGKSKSVRHYYNKSSPNRASKDKLSVALKKVFQQNPDLLTDENLDLPLGKFILQLKQNGNPDYKLLVHDHGDEEDYIKFKVKNLTKERGLYIWVVDNKPEYIGIASNSNGLENRINKEYGSVTPYKCTIDGQTQTCRSNTKLRDEFKAKKSISLYVTPIPVESLLSNQEFLQTMNDLGLTKHSPKNVLEVFEKFIIEKGNFKNGGWNRRMEENFVNRLQELAGIPKKSQILYRIDPSLEKLGIVDDSEIESGSDEWAELVSLIYQIPFDGDIENFLLQIDRKSQEIDFPISKLEMQLDVRGIEIV
tara:strand:- start:263 stop:1339 length:1077 start_codon:yes stop_codon:yes gene_type:complete